MEKKRIIKASFLVIDNPFNISVIKIDDFFRSLLSKWKEPDFLLHLS